MKGLKHSKIKNTAIIFEVLCRKLISEIMNNESSKSFKIIKKHFSKQSILYKELGLYKALVEVNNVKNENYANILLSNIIKARKNLSESDLKRAKYNVIKMMKDIYGESIIAENFSISINNYKKLATVYKLFEYDVVDNATDLLNCKISIIEGMLENSQTVEDTTWSSLSRGVRQKAFKLLMEKFNKKYDSLNNKQKKLLSVYINTPDKFTSYVHDELPYISSRLEGFSLTEDKALSIKLNELKRMILEIKNERKIHESHMSALLKTYNLIQELEK